MNTTVNAGLYMRLSVEDESDNESTSIQTQRAMLTDYCCEKGSALWTAMWMTVKPEPISIDRIEVSQRGKDKDGCPTQTITIYFHFGKAELELMDMISPALTAG